MKSIQVTLVATIEKPTSVEWKIFNGDTWLNVADSTDSVASVSVDTFLTEATDAWAREYAADEGLNPNTYVLAAGVLRTALRKVKTKNPNITEARVYLNG